MEPEFITYQKFNDIALANELAGLLDENHIEYIIEEEAINFDPTFAYRNDSKAYAVKVKSDEFETINDLLKQDAAAHIDEAEKDYYLFGFSDEELKDVVLKADEWNAFDVQLARKLLAERGKAISDQEIEEIENERLEELKEPGPSQTFWIGVGYLFACLGGVLGSFIGWHLFTYKKTLPNGE